MDYAALRFDEDQARQHVAAILGPGSCLELRVLKSQFHTGNLVIHSDTYHRTIGGWYTKPDHLMCDLARIKGVSAFLTINPVSLDLLARAPNKLELLDKERRPATKKPDILCYRWAYVDIDSIRSPDTSATDPERQHAIDCQAGIFADYPFLRESSIYGTSGNGAWILIRLPDYPPDAIHQSLIARFLHRLAREYNGDFVKIDTATQDPNRIMAVAGTFKCKGLNTPDRPWRRATIDSDPSLIPAPFDLIPFLGPEDTIPAAVPDPNTRPRHVNPYERPACNLTLRAAAYLKEVSPAISGKGGHNKTLDAACSLVKGFNLTPPDAYPFLAAWNATCLPPWDERDLWRKLAEADRIPDLDTQGNPRPRGYLLGQTGWAENPPATPAHFAPPSDPATDEFVPPEPRSYATPHDLARNIIADHFTHPDGPRVRYWNDDIFVWDGYSYRLIRRGEIDAKINRMVESQFKEEFNQKLIEHTFKAEDDKKGDGPKLKSVTTKVVADVLAAIRSVVLMELSTHPTQPTWIEHARPWQPSEILPTRSGLIHLPSLVLGQDFFAPLTPNFFGRYCLNYPFEPDAPSPTSWLRFLDQLWPKDPQSILLLQEWMGYLLTPDTSQQKIGMLIGPPRSGKGTIARVITSLMGSENVVNPTLASLSEHFGSASLLGKQVAIVTDARISGRNDTPAIVEKLLSISGEDSQTIHRKYKDEVTTRLDTRFMIISNELPNLRDSSGAFSSRMLILELQQSFLGHEDTTLSARLMDDLPGILRWAIEGWFRLRTNGRFTVPESSQDIMQEYQELSSPIIRFLREHCAVTPGAQVECALLYQRWCDWCKDNGIEHPGDRQRFGVTLAAAIPGLKKGRNRVDRARQQNYRGIRLLADAERLGLAESDLAVEYDFSEPTP